MPDVKTIGYSGTEFVHKDVSKVWLDAPESTEDNPVLVPFTYGEVLDGLEFDPDFSDGDISISMPDGYLAKSAVIKQPESLAPENIRKDIDISGIVGTYEGDPPVTQEVTVALDFSEGDMVIEPSEGSLIEKVTIPQPANLIPGNIAEGVDIAGVVGALAGGSGARFVYKSGSFTSAATNVTHGLGVTPAIFFFFSATSTDTNNKIVSAFGISSDFAAKIGESTYGSYFNYKYVSGSTNRTYGSRKSEFIDTTATRPNGVISNANENTIMLGNSSYGLISGNTYYWVAIGIME